jgi:hypothetical protein
MVQTMGTSVVTVTLSPGIWFDDETAVATEVG